MTQPPDIKFNLYWNVKIKLTKKGIEYYKVESKEMGPDKHGFIIIKLHEFIQLFGPTIKTGRSPYFEGIMFLLPPTVYPETVTVKIIF